MSNAQEIVRFGTVIGRVHNGKQFTHWIIEENETDERGRRKRHVVRICTDTTWDIGQSVEIWTESRDQSREPATFNLTRKNGVLTLPIPRDATSLDFALQTLSLIKTAATLQKNRRREGTRRTVTAVNRAEQLRQSLEAIKAKDPKVRTDTRAMGIYLSRTVKDWENVDRNKRDAKITSELKAMRRPKKKSARD